MVFPEKIIKKCLKEASTILMSKFGKEIEEELKENQSSIVTEMDVAAERKIEHIISTKYPNHSIIGEETGAVMTGSEYTWVIDPIDGMVWYASRGIATRQTLCGWSIFAFLRFNVLCRNRERRNM